MSSDDDTFLSAYMDGQLDSDQQHLVDSALVSSPELADRLRALTVVRDLVFGLPREAGVDVTPMVMSRIRLRRRSRSLFSPSRPWNSQARRAAAVAGILTLAAGLMLVVALTTYSRSRGHRAPTASAPVTRQCDRRFEVGRGDGGGEGIGPNRCAGTAIVLIRDGSHTPGRVQHARVPRSSTPPRAPNADRQPAPGDLELCRRLLDNSYQRRFFMIKSGRDGKAQQQVASVVEHTTRFGFFKITVSQGIVIDPRHPEEATVFALLVNPKELDRLRDQLKVALPDLVEEPSADPKIVTQLADIGHVQGLSPLADVSISHEALALRTRVGGGARKCGTTRCAPGRKVSSRPASEPEHGTDLAAGDDGPHAPDASCLRGAHSSDPVSGTEFVRSRPDLAANVPMPAKSDEMILGFRLDLQTTCELTRWSDSQANP